MSMPHRCDLADDVAHDLLKDHVTLALAKPDVLWVYGRVMHSTADWASMWQWRFFLSDLLDASDGLLLRQKTWETQVRCFLEGHAAGKFDAKQATVAAYGVRKMLSHLWYAKKHDKTIPKRWEKLQVLLAKVTCGHDSSSESPVESPSKANMANNALLLLDDADEADEAEAVSDGSEDVQVIV